MPKLQLLSLALNGSFLNNLCLIKVLFKIYANLYIHNCWHAELKYATKLRTAIEILKVRFNFIMQMTPYNKINHSKNFIGIKTLFYLQS